MAKSLAPRVAVLALLCAAQLSGAAADLTTHPLRASELLGLVAGNALPENVAREIATDGLAFRPDDHYRRSGRHPLDRSAAPGRRPVTPGREPARGRSASGRPHPSRLDR